MRQLNALSITSGAHGYVENVFAVLQEESEEEDDDVQPVSTQMAALTTQSQLTATTMAETLALVPAVINQLHANQQAMQQQFAAFTTQHNTTRPTKLRQQCSHQLHNSLSLILPHSIQQDGEEANVENMGVVGLQTL
jgi:hypothetical protein